MYTMEHVNRKLSSYDDERYLLADRLDGQLNPHTQTYGNHYQTAKENLMADQLELNAELIILHRRKQFTKNTFALRGSLNSPA